ncbi:class I SAM-dependent methyltransferase [Streptomyces sp. NBC_01239]|uniref:class I SAM-dependent methyltransferase n=1 Tax=Streptomyces sp. NBC_01239 TaxID=2903792 RepID=UPI0022551452|nr:class I SAM-dependent methyltransferase [Streptomyces sp. NBC_01239]MCX4816751.1 class I SAM-dependent methyltransferase [Streptomyces sp. NBC_01239]MCX4818199.1 class I SAM-dependent methyltransferase [Streptomyces sp. NBC_01239]
MSAEDVIKAWDQPEARGAVHPTRGISEDAYQASGHAQAELLAADIPAGAKVLDFGCGDGRVAIPLRAMGYDVTGADASPRMLAALAERDPDLATFQSDGSDFGKHLGRRKFDAVYCLAVLIHHDYGTGEQLVENLRAVTKKGGLLALDWPVSDDPSDGHGWLGVTTWARERQDEIATRLKMERVDADRPWSVWRAL